MTPSPQAPPSDDHLIGKAFADVLLPGLPPDLLDFAACFGNDPNLAAEVVASLSFKEDVVACGPACHGLLPYGVTPVFALSLGVSMGNTLRRLNRIAGLPPTTVRRIAAGNEGNDRSGDPVEPAEFVRAWSFLSKMPEPLAAAMVHWLLRVARHRPFIVNGFRLAPAGGEALSAFPVERADDPHAMWRAA